MIRAYFLTRFTYKNSNGNTFIDFEQVYKELNCSKTLGKKIIRNQQATLAEYSCQSVFEWYIENNRKTLSIELLQKMLRKDDDNRPVLPYYYFTQILWYNITQHQYPVLIIVNRYLEQKLDTLYLDRKSVV